VDLSCLTPLLTRLGTGLLTMSLLIEGAMFPTPCQAALSTYELYLKPNTKIQMSSNTVPTDALRSLRISGTCALHGAGRYPQLTHFAMSSVKGNYFESSGLAALAGAPLVSFAHVQADSLSYELRDLHLHQLVADGNVGRTLRTLVLCGCTRLTTAGVAASLALLPMLEHFALAIVTQDPPTAGFVHALPPGLRVFKLRLARLRKWSLPFVPERRAVWAAVEDDVLRRTPALEVVCLDDDIDTTDDFVDSWRSIASNQRFILRLGAWAEEI
jgi:hypothetical protein